MNKFIHPRNIYKQHPNFTDLAAKYPEFREITKLVQNLIFIFSGIFFTVIYNYSF